MGLVEPTSIAMKEGKRSAIVFRGDSPRYSWMYLLAPKRDTSRALERSLVDTSMDGSIKIRIKIMRSDNGSDFRGKFGAILDRHKVKAGAHSPGDSELNGVVERAIAMLRTPQQTAKRKTHKLSPNAEIPQGSESSWG